MPRCSCSAKKAHIFYKTLKGGQQIIPKMDSGNKAVQPLLYVHLWVFIAVRLCLFLLSAFVFFFLLCAFVLLFFAVRLCFFDVRLCFF